MFSGVPVIKMTGARTGRSGQELFFFGPKVHVVWQSTCTCVNFPTIKFWTSEGVFGCLSHSYDWNHDQNSQKRTFFFGLKVHVVCTSTCSLTQVHVVWPKYMQFSTVEFDVVSVFSGLYSMFVVVWQVQIAETWTKIFVLVKVHVLVFVCLCLQVHVL